MNSWSLLLALALGTGTEPGLEPRGDLVFCSQRDGDFEIYRMDIPSRDVHALTVNGAQDLDPCWTAEGKEIVFVSNRDGRYALYIMEADGREARLLHKEPGSIRRPSLSPDGRWVAFTVFDRGEPEPGEGKVPPFGRVRVFDRSTRRTAAVSPAGWSADDASFDAHGRSLYFAAQDKGPMIVQVPMDGKGVFSEPKPVFQDSKALAAPQSDPSGKKLFLVRGGSPLWLESGKTSPAFQALRGRVRKAALGPSGPAVLAVKSGGQYDLWLFSARGAEPQRLTSHPADDLSPSLK